MLNPIAESRMDFGWLKATGALEHLLECVPSVETEGILGKM